MQKTNRDSQMRIILLSSVLILSLIVKSKAARLGVKPAPAAHSPSSHVPSSAPSSAPSSSSVYIVHTEAPKEGVNPEAYHLNTLASVYGSKEAAKGALLYSYKTAMSGFSARLTKQQASQLQKQPGVLSVVPDQAVQLHYTTDLNV